MSPVRIITVVGTRPEIIRLSRVLPRLDETFDHHLVHTGQNYDYRLNQIFFEELRLRPPDHYLGVDTSSLAHVLAGTLLGAERVLRDLQPDAMLVLGDTNSCIAALMAKRMHVPVYHMEAGNRCFDENVPEETNRRLIDHIADFNLVYTEHARRNLLAEGLPTRRIVLTGSPMYEVLSHYRPAIDASSILERLMLTPRGYLLVSAHREENVDSPDRLDRLLTTLTAAAVHYARPILVSTHPRTRNRVADKLPDDKRIVFHEPFGFFDYVHLQKNSYCVLSDSGTISEESAILNFPAVTIRDSIERPEALDTGSIVMTGLDADAVLDAVDIVVRQHGDGNIPVAPADYTIANVSQRTVNFIRSTVHAHHEWAGVRTKTQSPGSAVAP